MAYIFNDSEKSLREQLPLLKSESDRQEWFTQCNQCLDSLNDYLKIDYLSVGARQSAVSILGRLKYLQAQVQQRVWTGHGYEHKEQSSSRPSLLWDTVESAFRSRILTGVVINLDYIDPRIFLENSKKLVIDHLNNIISQHLCVKVNVIFNGQFMVKDKTDFKSFNTKNVVLLQSSNLHEWYETSVLSPILTSLEEFQERDSGWALSKIINLMINVNKCEPMRGSCFFESPKTVRDRRCVVNVKSKDNACFAWAVVAALYPVSKHIDRFSSYPPYETVLNVTGITFPMTLNQVKKFERQNDLSINIFNWENSKNKCVPLLLTNNKKDKHINLLMLCDERTDVNHFVWIKNLSRLVSSQVSKRKCAKYICDRCLHYFHSDEKLTEHSVNCAKMNDCAVILPTEETKWLQFENHRRKERLPFIVYADFECLLKKVNADRIKEGALKTCAYQEHEAFSVGYYMHCSYDNSLSRYQSYRGLDCVSWFVNELKGIAERLDPIFSNVVRMNDFSIDKQKSFNSATHCHICEQPFKIDDVKVRDHCHFTGKYRGPAHNGCNLNYKDSRVIPIVFHNLTGYDAHFVINELATAFDGTTSVLPITKEKYISFTKYVQHCKIHLRFIDSFKFMSSSLDKLSSYLETNQLEILKSQFDNVDETSFKLLTRKGVFPYDYISNFEKLHETRLPSREDFYNKLSDSDISDEDYNHAAEIWRRFNIETLGDYSDLYLKTDILLLADVFENFRNSCVGNYGLDPAYYYTLPGFTWDAMLRYTRVKLELLTDIDMLMFIERGIRGGLSQCSGRYSRANNKYMESYDSTKPSNYLMYFDVNNLYGWAMSQPLPYRDFAWVDDTTNFNIDSIPTDSNVGYVLEVDLEYPHELHDKHADLPFCPIRQKPPGKSEEKLLATVHDKERYVIHYRNLQQCLRNGLVLRKIHRVLQFQQSRWLSNYIQLNTNLRTKAANDFEKNLFKLMNNAVFGKTMENVRNHVEVKLITKWDGRYGAEALISKPNFHSRSVFSENLVAIELRKLEVKFNKPIYVGMCILDVSKTCLYEFHHEYMREKFQAKCTVLYTDTDSLIYDIECDDAYEIMKRDIEKFDTSDYPIDNVYGMPRMNKKVPGLMKDENNGAIMTEFVGLRAKMYALKVCDEKIVKKLKGIKNYVVSKSICFEDYMQCLREKEEMERYQNCIRSKLHNVYTISEFKIALSPHDDKRYILPNSTKTLPWGHYRISTQ